MKDALDQHIAIFDFDSKAIDPPHKGSVIWPGHFYTFHKRYWFLHVGIFHGYLNEIVLDYQNTVADIH